MLQTKEQLLELLAIAEQNEIKAAERLKEQKILSEKRKELFEDVSVMKKMSVDFAKENDLERSKHYAELALQTEKQAREIVLDGETETLETLQNEFVPSQHFGKGSKWSFFPLWRVLSVILSILVLGYFSHVVQGMKTQISISFWSEIQHFAITLLCWSLMWFFVDLMIYKKYRAFYDYLNTSDFPQFDLVSKCLDSKFSEIYVLSFYCFQAFTFVLMYLHNPITNS